MSKSRDILASDRAASSAEFALVLPLFLILIFGIIDAGRFAWEYNKAEKATQVGARVAIVTNVLSAELRDEGYAGQTEGVDDPDTVKVEKIGAGDRIPAGALGTLKCTSGGCTCETTPCPSGVGTVDSDTFNNTLVARMKAISPTIEAANVEVRYSGSGFGFAGSASGGGGGGGGGAGGGGGGGGGATEPMEISPLITVTLQGMTFHPVTCLVFLCELPLPKIATTLTAEDASGAFSN